MAFTVCGIANKLRKPMLCGVPDIYRCGGHRDDTPPRSSSGEPGGCARKAGQRRTGWRGYFSGSAVHMTKVDARPRT